MKDITLLRIEEDHGETLKFFETIEEFQTYMNRHYKSNWKYEVYNCMLRENNNTPHVSRCW